MAKKSKGQVGLVSNGDTSSRQVPIKPKGNVAEKEATFNFSDKTYTMIFSINALCELENDYDDVFAEFAGLLSGSGKKRNTVLRKVFRAGLSDHHPEMTERQAGLLMTAMGFHAALTKVADAFTLAFPIPEGAEVPLESAGA
jgi:hypothetical protein